MCWSCLWMAPVLSPRKQSWGLRLGPLQLCLVELGLLTTSYSWAATSAAFARSPYREVNSSDACSDLVNQTWSPCQALVWLPRSCTGSWEIAAGTSPSAKCSSLRFVETGAVGSGWQWGTHFYTESSFPWVYEVCHEPLGGLGLLA